MTHTLHPSILREYDIRGPVGVHLGEGDARAIGRSFATRVRCAGGTRVAVGRDGRTTSPMLEAALVEGLLQSGVDVVRIGLGPTPMLYYAEHALGVDAGIQVTGSHNPADQNGFKMVLHHLPFFGDDIRDLARLAAAGDWEEGAGTATDAEVMDDYVARLIADHDVGAYRIGWDTGNGASGPVVEKLVRRLPGEHHLLFTSVDGTFPHHHPDPSVERNLDALKALVAREQLDMGFAFDGDGDRIGAVDARGRVLWGDQLLAILAEPALREHPGAAIVADVKTSSHLFDRVRALGGRPVMAATGHSGMKTAIRRTGAPLGGELSGHLFFAGDWYGFDDAQYAAIMLIRAIHESGRSLAELRDAMPALAATPDLRFPADDAGRVVADILARLEVAGVAVDRTDGARVTMPDGWWLLRASNTEDRLTARAEGRDQAALDRLLADLDAQLALSGVARD